uniref:Calponin-homology (CH) domain-containing protein n=1 Tax=Romanomermis culicivorax TaxID=13658 RepID=A0A915KK08_ROMCU
MIPNGNRTSTNSNGRQVIVARTPNEKKKALLKWCQIKTREYGNKIELTNFSTSWADGLAFCALVHHFFKDAFDFDKLRSENVAENCTLAFKIAEERANISPLLDVEDMVKMWPKPDYKCIFTYVQCMYDKLKEFDKPK